jgi:predicted TPR repeat methyltransferase
MASASLQTARAEALFDEPRFFYGKLYAKNDGLNRVIQNTVQALDKDATVPDVGCGTDKPVSSALADAGLTGFDVSQAKVNIYRKQMTKGKFFKADMTEFQPHQQFDAIFAIFSLFQMSHRSIYSMAFKFASWPRPDGLLIQGTISSDDFKIDQAHYGSSGEYIDEIEVPFMGR